MIAARNLYINNFTLQYILTTLIPEYSRCVGTLTALYPVKNDDNVRDLSTNVQRKMDPFGDKVVTIYLCMCTYNIFIFSKQEFPICFVIHSRYSSDLLMFG